LAEEGEMSRSEEIQQEDMRGMKDRKAGLELDSIDKIYRIREQLPPLSRAQLGTRETEKRPEMREILRLRRDKLDSAQDKL
jgi:hypothetical protein